MKQVGRRDELKNFYLFSFITATLCLIIGLAGGIFIGTKRGVPFVAEREDWTIGIYEGDSPFHFPASQSRRNPVLTAEDVTDVPAKFVADPFLIHEDETWYLFFEVYNQNTKQGDLAVATSSDASRWQYQQIILDEPFHLSYPYVFKWQDDYYLIPESFEANSIRLYKAMFVTTLVDNVERVDNSIVYFNSQWWIFAAPTSNDTLHLYYANDLMGPWREHPDSPIVENNNHISRPSGRVLVYEDQLYRYTMDVNPSVGTHLIWAFEITDISPTTYAETLASEQPILMASGQGWNGNGMHQIDVHQIGPDRWMAAVDGYGKYLVFGLRY
jgi:hypothetical protein